MTEPFVTVATFSHSIEAHVARIKLENEGVFCLLADENTVNANWLYSNVIGGVKLRVRESDATRARELLQIPGESSSGPTCPKCGSKGVFEQKIRRRLGFVSWIILNFPLPVRRTLTCGSCGHHWR